MSAPRAQQKARLQLKQASVTPQVQRQNNREVPTVSTGAPQPAKPGQPKSSVTSSRIKRVPKKEPEMIGLCSSDDDVLVEVTKAAYQNTTPIVETAPFRPGTSIATLQLIGESPQKQSVSRDQHSDNIFLLTTKVTVSVGASEAGQIWICSVSSR